MLFDARKTHFEYKYYVEQTYICIIVCAKYRAIGNSPPPPLQYSAMPCLSIHKLTRRVCAPNRFCMRLCEFACMCVRSCPGQTHTHYTHILAHAIFIIYLFVCSPVLVAAMRPVPCAGFSSNMRDGAQAHNATQTTIYSCLCPRFVMPWQSVCVCSCLCARERVCDLYTGRLDVRGRRRRTRREQSNPTSTTTTTTSTTTTSTVVGHNVHTHTHTHTQNMLVALASHTHAHSHRVTSAHTRVHTTYNADPDPSICA